MNKTILVSLIQKNIEELILLTQGFKEMDFYPEAILNLARNKADDIGQYIEMLKNTTIEKTTNPVVEKQADPVVTHLQEVKEVVVVAEVVPTWKTEHETATVTELPPIVIEFDTETDSEIAIDIEPEIDLEMESETEIEELISIEEFPTFDTKTSAPGGVSFEVEKPSIEPKTATQAKVEVAIEPKNGSAKKAVLGEVVTTNVVSINDIHAKTEKTGIHANIANKKIDDIRQAISLGDRFRFQRELFRNNGEDMNKTLNYINMLATYEEIESFLKSKYAWEDDNEAAFDLLQIVKRKF